jgi:hypothetical protein
MVRNRQFRRKRGGEGIFLQPDFGQRVYKRAPANSEFL